MTVNWMKAQRKAAHTARWAVTMTKVRIRQALARTRWQLITFCGVSGAESVGVVDLMAIRKDHGKPLPDTKRVQQGILSCVSDRVSAHVPCVATFLSTGVMVDSTIPRFGRGA